MMVGVPLDLPKPTPRASVNPRPVVVSLDQDRQIYIGNDPVPAEALIPRLAQLRQAEPDITIYVRGHKAIEYDE